MKDLITSPQSDHSILNLDNNNNGDSSWEAMLMAPKLFGFILSIGVVLAVWHF